MGEHTELDLELLRPETVISILHMRSTTSLNSHQHYRTPPAGTESGRASCCLTGSAAHGSSRAAPMHGTCGLEWDPAVTSQGDVARDWYKWLSEYNDEQFSLVSP